MIARVGPGIVAAGLIGLLVVAVLVVSGGGEDLYVVRAVMEDAAGLRKNSDVKVAGVPGGTVSDIELTDGDRALVTMSLDPETVPVGAGARATTRPVNLLGEKYVDLDQGDPRRPQPTGSVIPVERTSAAVELDDVLNSLTPDTRGALRILMNEAGVAMAGRGTDVNGLLEELQSSLDRIEDVATEIGTENRTLRRLIAQGDRVVGSVTGRREQLAGFVESARDALRETSRRRAQLGTTVAAAPGALRQLTTSLTDLERAAADLRPAAQQLRAASPPLTEALAALPGFVDAARPTLREVRTVSPALTRLARRSTPRLRRLAPTATRLRDFTGELAPVTASFDEGGAFDALLGLADGWARTIQTSDGLGHVFRLRIQFDEELATSLLQRFGILTPTRQRATRRPARPPRPAVAQAPAPPSAPAPRPSPSRKPVAPTLGELPARLGADLDEIVDGVRGALAGKDAPAAGADRGGLLGTLLGGS